MKASFIAVVSFFIARAALAQDWQQGFVALWEDSTPDSLERYLQAWESAEPQSADMHIAWFNYYYDRSAMEVLALSDNPGEEDNLVLSDPESDETMGYLTSQMIYDDSLFDLSIAWIERGIALYPDRLDMHFGKIYALGDRGFFERQGEEIMALLTTSESRGHRWSWTDGVPVEDGPEMLKSSIQDYLYGMFDAEEPDTQLIYSISERMDLLFPGTVEYPANMAACLLFTGQYEEALKIYERILVNFPDDVVVLNNSAYACEQLGLNARAITFFEHILEVGSEEDKDYARMRIEELR